MELKKCNKCSTEKERSEFYKAAKELDGLMYSCKDCYKIKDRERRIKHADKEKARHAKYQQENPEKGAKRQARYRERHPEKIKRLSKRLYWENKEKENKRSRAYGYANREKISARHYAYRKANISRCREYEKRSIELNRGRVYAHNAKRRARVLKATVKWADLNKIKQIYTECIRISKETGVEHHVDHIIPLKSKCVCGLHVENNLRIIPGSENARKNNTFKPG